MSIQMSIIAKCDNEDPCPNALTVPTRNMTQVFIFLIDHNWSVVDDTNSDNAATYCPEHAETT